MPELNPKMAVLAILVGSVVGSAILAFTARLGQETGRSSGELILIAFGLRFGQLPVLLNVILLFG